MKWWKTQLFTFLVAAVCTQLMAQDLSVVETKGAITIDGDLNEADWQNSFKAELKEQVKRGVDKTRSGEASKKPFNAPFPVEPATAYTLCDKENLYFAFKVQESNTPFIKTSKKPKKWQKPAEMTMGSDNVCVVLDLGHHGLFDNYLIYVNAEGLPYVTSSWPNHASAQEDHLDSGVQTAAKINGDKTWTVEIKVPFSFLLRYPKKGMVDKIGINFRRVQWGEDADKKNVGQTWNRTLSRGNEEDHFRRMVLWNDLPSYTSYTFEGTENWANLALPDEVKILKIPTGTLKVELKNGWENQLEFAFSSGWNNTVIVGFDENQPRMPRRDDLRPDHSGLSNDIEIMPESLASSGKGSFVKKPTITKNDKGYQIDFELSEQTDITVGIREKGGRYIKHIGGGVVGDNSPEPFANGLKQSIQWDGKDNLGKPVSGNVELVINIGLSLEFKDIVDFNAHKGTKLTWPVVLDVQNLPSPKITKVKMDHGGGGAYLSAYDPYDNTIYIPGYSKYDGNTNELQGEFKPGKQNRWSALIDQGELAFTKDGHIISGGWNHLLKIDKSGKPVDFEEVGRSFIPNLFRGHSNPHRGHDVGGPDDDIYVIHHFCAHGNRSSQISQVTQKGELKSFGLINLKSISSAGLQVDKKGNIYLGVSVNPAGSEVPKYLDFKGDDKAKYLYGMQYASIVKFTPKGGKAEWVESAKLSASPKYGDPSRVDLFGAEWILNGFSNIVSRGGSGTLTHCACQNARFEMDQFERLLIPDAIAGVINIADTRGNRIGRWGKRGEDLTKLEFKWPATIIGNDDYLYVQDYVQLKSIRIQQKYATTEIVAIP